MKSLTIDQPTFGIVSALVIASAVTAGALVLSRSAAQRERERIEDFRCGYQVGLNDSVAFLNPALSARPEFQPPPRCADITLVATAHGVARIVPRLRGPLD